MTTKRVAAVLCAVASILGVASFTPAGAASASRWTIVPTASNVRHGNLAAVSCPAPNACVAVGTQDTAGGQLALIQRWDGRRWTAQASPKPAGATSSSLEAVQCPNPSNCIAVGQYSGAMGAKTLALRWTNHRWTLMATPNPLAAVSGLSGLACTGPNNCIAVGGYFVNTGSSRRYALAEHWNGTEWRIVSTPTVPNNSLFTGVACAAPTNCIAVGYSHALSLTRPLIARWNGSSWSIVASPNLRDSTDNELTAVTCAAATRCIAVGRSDYGTLVQRWNGASWSIARSPNPAGSSGAALAGVSCPSAGRCFTAGAAFGVVYRKGAIQHQLTQRLTPAGNSLVNVPIPRGARLSSLNAISCANDANCVAVGNYYRGFSRSLLAVRFGP
jgi:hypothetical protein